MNDRPWENLPDEYFKILGSVDEPEDESNDYGMDAFVGRFQRFDDWIEIANEARRLWAITDCGDGGYER